MSPVTDFRRVRAVRPADAARVVELIIGSNRLHGYEEDAFDEAAAERDLFGERPILRGAVAEIPGRQGAPFVVGVILWCDAYEAAYAARGGYVVDFFVEAAHRGAGLGKALLAHAAAAVKAEGGVYLWWASAPWNERAREFYAAQRASDETVHAHALTRGDFERLSAQAGRDLLSPPLRRDR